ncbi:MAG TPA: addiction module toxin, HicA family [Anaerolineae bacterium]|nr:addiction module toxin, HicA family [Anaerolineae bacterium]
MPRKYPPLTPDEVVRILRARGFDYDHSRGSHEYYKGTIKGIPRTVTVDVHYGEFDAKMIRFLLDQSGLTREEFYGSTKRTAKKINLRAERYPIPLDEKQG